MSKIIDELRSYEANPQANTTTPIPVQRHRIPKGALNADAVLYRKAHLINDLKPYIRALQHPLSEPTIKSYIEDPDKCSEELLRLLCVTCNDPFIKEDYEYYLSLSEDPEQKLRKQRRDLITKITELENKAYELRQILKTLS